MAWMPPPTGIVMCHSDVSESITQRGAVRLMRTRIGLLAQPEPMRSIVGATQREQRLGLALNWCVSRSGVHLGLYKQSNPTPSLHCAFSGPEWYQQANSRVTKRQTKHVCIDAQTCGRVANIAGMVNIVRVKVGVNLIPIKLIHYNQQLEWVEWRCCQTNENSHRIAGAALIYALNSWRHSVRAAVRLSLKLSRE